MKRALQIPQEALGTCRSCHAPVIWVLTERGRRMPLDREETMERGALLFVIDDKGVSHRSQTGRGYRSHFSTCPDAAQWRKEHAWA